MLLVGFFLCNVALLLYFPIDFKHIRPLLVTTKSLSYAVYNCNGLYLK